MKYSLLACVSAKYNREVAGLQCHRSPWYLLPLSKAAADVHVLLLDVLNVGSNSSLGSSMV